MNIFVKNKKTLTSILVKPASADCNLHCEYCFYLEKAGLFPESSVHRMKNEILNELIKQAMQAGTEFISFGWQGGEPTLMGTDFFYAATALQKKYGRQGQQVGNGIQTNGLLIDDAWCKLFLDYSFLIGLSLDGPRHIHDKYRVFQNSHGSWEKVHQSALRMLEQGAAVNALSVVNNYSWHYPEEIYYFLKEVGFEFMQFIPCVELHPDGSGQMAPFSVEGEQYGEFLCRVYDCWRKDFQNSIPATSIRFFDSLFHLYVNYPAPECTLQNECGTYIAIEHNGDIYSCDFFVQPEWKLGNVMTDDLVTVLNGAKQKEFGCLKCARPPECIRCRWLAKCLGGCTKDRFHSLNPGHNHLCAAYKMLMEHADMDMQKMAAQWIAHQKEEEQIREKQLEEISPAPSKFDVGRNEPCPCGSGKKFKKCCGKG